MKLPVLMRVTLSLGIACLAQGQGRFQGRSLVITQQGIVATSQVLASQAGIQMLTRGGSAVDAAIAANAVLSVVEPMMNGLGGDLFVLYRDGKTGKLTGLNASGPAPKELTAGYLAKKALHSMPEIGIDSVSVPGAVDGWAKMHRRYGKLAWKELFQPAIAYAVKGFGVTEVIQEAWSSPAALKTLRSDANASRVFLPAQKPPETGSLFRNPEMGHAFQLLADAGPESFYRGEIATAILKTSQRLGGTLTESDLSGYASE